MFDYEQIKEAVIANMDFLPEDPVVRETFFENLIRLLMYP